MSDELVRRIAAAAARGFYRDSERLLRCDNLCDGTWSDRYVADWEQGARAVIEALGLVEQRGVRPDDDGFERRYVTDWEEVDE